MPRSTQWLKDRCIEDAKKRPHPTIPGKTVWEVFEEERPSLMDYRGPFDGFHATEWCVGVQDLPGALRQQLVQRGRPARSGSRWMYGPTPIGSSSARMARPLPSIPAASGRGEIAYEPWHYVPILERKPGAHCVTARPFKDWKLPDALGRLRTRLAAHDDGDRQFVTVLAAVLEDGLEDGLEGG